MPADNFKKYNTKHNPKISILKPKIWVKQENWASNISILLHNHHQPNYSYNIYKVLAYKFACHDHIIETEHHSKPRHVQWEVW